MALEHNWAVKTASAYHQSDDDMWKMENVSNKFPATSRMSRETHHKSLLMKLKLARKRLFYFKPRLNNSQRRCREFLNIARMPHKTRSERDLMSFCMRRRLDGFFISSQSALWRKETSLISAAEGGEEEKQIRKKMIARPQAIATSGWKLISRFPPLLSRNRQLSAGSSKTE